MIKKYNLFIESTNNNFTIYHFYDWLRDNSFGNDILNKSELIKHTEHFIGKGQWAIIENYFNNIFEKLNSVDIDYINDRLLNIFDEYIYHDMKYAITAVAYSDYKYISEVVYDKYDDLTGLLSISKINESKKLDIITHFLSNTLYNILWISATNQTRRSIDELFVNSDYYALKNFKNQNLEIMKDNKITSLYNYNKFLKLKENFSIEKVLELYVPCIYITISNYGFSPSKMLYSKIKKEFEDILPSILHDINYDKIIWEHKLPPDKKDIEIYDYSLKIILNQ
jgi:predicted nuclease of predicted toxin-antitoxin system